MVNLTMATRETKWLIITTETSPKIINFEMKIAHAKRTLCAAIYRFSMITPTSMQLRSLLHFGFDIGQRRFSN